MKILLRILLGLVLLELIAKWVTPFIERENASLNRRAAQQMLDVNLGYYSSCDSDLTSEEAAELEESLEKDASDLLARAHLLGYYRHCKTADETEKYWNHALWVIRNAPTSPLGKSVATEMHQQPEPFYDHGKRIWLEQCEQHPTDAVILRNAAEYVRRKDELLAKKLLLSGKKLQPHAPDWSERLSQLYHYKLNDESESDESALLELERAVRLAKPSHKFHLQTDLPLYAYNAGQFKKAKNYANYILHKAPRKLHANEKAEVKYKAHTVLGRIALRDGQIESAKSHLLASADIPGSCVLSSFGPDFTFAKEMLDKGERETVLVYLKSCKKFWKSGEEKLSLWRDEIENGEMPERWKHL
jgi:hypothetical protein